MEALNRILERFEQISAVPRGTKHEALIREWLQGWAEEHGLRSASDAAGNLVIYIPASARQEDRPTVILQGHMDMVWQKTPDSEHDFTRDPIRVLREGDWLKADRTTLGADNGIAIAIMLALAEDGNASHPPLEFLLTVEEELGVTGAFNLDASLITGKTLINLDSEEEGALTIGCAGGWTVTMALPVAWEEIEADSAYFHLRVDGLQGGHSGGDIQKHRGNANKIIGRALAYVQAEIPIRLSTLKGGTVRNAIPREAEAVFACPKEQGDLVRQRLSNFYQIAAGECASSDNGLRFLLEETTAAEKAVSNRDSFKMVQLLTALPNGVDEMSEDAPGAVETSNNVGIVELQAEGLHIVSNQRSSIGSRLVEITERVDMIGQLAGARTNRNEMTLPWQPNKGSQVLKKCQAAYEACFGDAPKVDVVHGGLECGILSERCGGLDAISLGPTIINPHSPAESLHVPSVARVWKLLTVLLESF